MSAELDQAIEAFLTVGDWLVVWMTEEYEGWAASLHDTSGCFCHADDDLKCHAYCCDPTSITAEQAHALIALIALGVDWEGTAPAAVVRVDGKDGDT